MDRNQVRRWFFLLSESASARRPDPELGAKQFSFWKRILSTHFFLSALPSGSIGRGTERIPRLFDYGAASKASLQTSNVRTLSVVIQRSYSVSASQTARDAELNAADRRADGSPSATGQTTIIFVFKPFNSQGRPVGTRAPLAILPFVLYPNTHRDVHTSNPPSTFVDALAGFLRHTIHQLRLIPCWPAGNSANHAQQAAGAAGDSQH
jgi:hypothetical protein